MQKREWSNLLVVLGLVLAGLCTMAFFNTANAENPSEWLAQWDFYINHHHIPPAPELTINYSDGKSGSYFTFTGQNYPLTYQGLVTVNTHPVGVIQVDEFGGFIFELSTTASDPLLLMASEATEEGLYIVQVESAEARADTRFVLSNDAPLRPSSGSENIFPVPPGIAYTSFTYLPLVMR
jgi:hypothetical protein